MHNPRPILIDSCDVFNIDVRPRAEENVWDKWLLAHTLECIA